MRRHTTPTATWPLPWGLTPSPATWACRCVGCVRRLPWQADGGDRSAPFAAGLGASCGPGGSETSASASRWVRADQFRSGAASAALRTACPPRAQYTMSLFELPARCTLVESALTIRGGPSGFRGAPPAQPAWPGHADLAHQPALRGRPAWQPSGPGAACPRGWTPGQACRCITPSAPRTPQGTSPPTSRRCKALRRPASCAACARRRGRQGHMRVATATASCTTLTV